MKRLSAFLLFLFYSAVLSAQADYEHIIAFDIDIYVQKDASIEVTERITVFAEGIQIKRGIFRTLPSKRNLNNRTSRVKYDVVSVKRDGVKEKYHTARESGDFLIYIGDKNKTLERGIYEYEITYKSPNHIGFFDDFDEIYWNVTGNDWDFDIARVSARVHLPEGTSVLSQSCYTGYYNSTSTDNCTSRTLSDQTIEWTSQNLTSLQGLTVAAGFNQGVITKPKMPFYVGKTFLRNVLSVLGLGLLTLMWRLWDKHGRDHEKPTVYPQFRVPKDFSPASLAYVAKEKFDNKYITTSIINLAVKGYIQIKEETKKSLFSSKTHYNLVKLKEGDSGLPIEEAGLMSDLFRRENEVSIDGKYQSVIGTAVTNYQNNLNKKEGKLISKGSNRKYTIYIFLAISAVFWGLMFLANRHSFHEVKSVAAIVTYVFSAFYFVLLLVVRTSISKYIWIIPSLVIIFFILASVGADSSGNLYHMAINSVLVGMLLLGAFSYLIKQPSEELLESQSLIEGFKMYLQAAESEIIKFFNPPKMTPELFERYLPYAIALGVEGIWGKKFEQQMAQSATQYESSWYHGTSGFSSNKLSGMTNSFTSSMARSSTAPSSSGSGSGGGGFSGGGGGGGGGGGW